MPFSFIRVPFSRYLVCLKLGFAGDSDGTEKAYFLICSPGSFGEKSITKLSSINKIATDAMIIAIVPIILFYLIVLLICLF